MTGGLTVGSCLSAHTSPPTDCFLLPAFAACRSNEYFRNLLNFDWEKHKGPGGHWQWRPKHKPGSSKANSTLPDIMMLTADIALLKDPVYLKWVQHYAGDEKALTNDFGKVWYKLMTRDMGPATRCIGPKVPAAQVSQLDNL
jgi:catalase-peroxidase